MQQVNTRSATTPISTYLYAGLLAGVVGAVVANLWYLVWLMAGGSSYPELNAFTISLAGIIPAVIGAFFYYGLRRFTKNPATVFVVVGLVLATLSIVPNFVSPMDPAPGFAAASSPMHYIVALSVLLIVPRFVKSRH